MHINFSSCTTMVTMSGTRAFVYSRKGTFLKWQWYLNRFKTFALSLGCPNTKYRLQKIYIYIWLINYPLRYTQSTLDKLDYYQPLIWCNLHRWLNLMIPTEQQKCHADDEMFRVLTVASNLWKCCTTWLYLSYFL